MKNDVRVEKFMTVADRAGDFMRMGTMPSIRNPLNAVPDLPETLVPHAKIGRFSESNSARSRRVSSGGIEGSTWTR
jgi:hypothetical protein